MHVNIDKVKTTAFVLKNRLRGYKLLQNPKGTNPNEVTMLKSWFGVNSKHLDKLYSNKLIHRKKEGDSFVTERTEVFTEYLMNPETKTYSGKNKNIYVYKSNGDVMKHKCAMEYGDMWKRPLPNWLSEDEESNFIDKLFKENQANTFSYNPLKSGFLKVLITNLLG